MRNRDYTPLVKYQGLIRFVFFFLIQLVELENDKRKKWKWPTA